MKKIFIRSPYFITIDEEGQTNAKIEIFLWNKGDTEPTVPIYTLSKNVPSLTQTKISWNVANFAKDFIKPISPTNITVPTPEDVKCWCYMKVISYSNGSEVSSEKFVCLNGYTLYSNGYNQYSEDAVIPLLNVNIILQHNNYVNCWVDNNALDYSYVTANDEYDFDANDNLWKLPINYSIENYLYLSNPETGTFFNIVSKEVCEPKYTPMTCSFINRFGGWEYLTFFKASFSNIETEYKEFDLLPSGIDYNVLQGQRKRFNHQGKQSIKCNTGYVDENYFDLIQDLFLSELVLLDNIPVLVKSKSSEKKTHIRDKVINYEIEFEYNFGLINDVI
jgi:hypothetical protein